MKVFKTLSVVLLTMVVWTTAAAQQTTPTRPPLPGLLEVIASEKLEPTMYSNAYLGLRLSIPEGWTVQGDDTKKRLIEIGREYLKPTNDAQRAEMEKSISNTAVLLTLLKSPADVPTQSGLLVVIEKLPSPSATATPYVIELKKLILENSTLNYALEKDVHEEIVNGQRFMAIDVFTGKDNLRVNQKYSCQIRKGYALCMIETYASDAQLAALTGLVNGLTLK
jgi:hypothetical protein